MTQQEALEKVKAMLSEIADGIKLEREHSIGCKYGLMNHFRIWDHSNRSICRILASSEHSWEHAVAMVEAERIAKTVAADTSAVEDEVAHD